MMINLFSLVARTKEGVSKKKKEGPFKANRILDTTEVKVDIVFTKKDEKPVALFIIDTEDEARRIGAEGYAGPTKFGGKGVYDRGKTWVSRAIYWPNNIPGARFDEAVSKQIRNAVVTGGTIVPMNIEEVTYKSTIPISGTAVLKTDHKGYAELNGSFPVSTSRIMRLCPYCNSEINAACKKCPICGKKL